MSTITSTNTSSTNDPTTGKRSRRKTQDEKCRVCQNRAHCKNLCQKHYREAKGRAPQNFVQPSIGNFCSLSAHCKDEDEDTTEESDGSGDGAAAPVPGPSAPPESNAAICTPTTALITATAADTSMALNTAALSLPQPGKRGIVAVETGASKRGRTGPSPNANAITNGPIVAEVERARTLYHESGEAKKRDLLAAEMVIQRVQEADQFIGSLSRRAAFRIKQDEADEKAYRELQAFKQDRLQGTDLVQRPLAREDLGKAEMPLGFFVDDSIGRSGSAGWSCSLWRMP